jgi:hypothetical protein
MKPTWYFVQDDGKFITNKCDDDTLACYDVNPAIAMLNCLGCMTSSHIAVVLKNQVNKLLKSWKTDA